MLNRSVCAKCRKNSGFEFEPYDGWSNPLTYDDWLCVYSEKKGKLRVSPESAPPACCIHKFEHGVAAAAGDDNARS